MICAPVVVSRCALAFESGLQSLVLWVVSSVTYPGAALVAQVSNLPYRGFPNRKRHDVSTVSRLEVGDTAGWKPALRQRIYVYAY
jgi:hypothetical protein